MCSRVANTVLNNKNKKCSRHKHTEKAENGEVAAKNNININRICTKKAPKDEEHIK